MKAIMFVNQTFYVFPFKLFVNDEYHCSYLIEYLIQIMFSSLLFFYENYWNIHNAVHSECNLNAYRIILLATCNFKRMNCLF